MLCKTEQIPANFNSFTTVPFLLQLRCILCIRILLFIIKGIWDSYKNPDKKCSIIKNKVIYQCCIIVIIIIHGTLTFRLQFLLVSDLVYLYFVRSWENVATLLQCKYSKWDINYIWGINYICSTYIYRFASVSTSGIYNTVQYIVQNYIYIVY